MANVVVVGATLSNSRPVPFGNASIWGFAPTFDGLFSKLHLSSILGDI